MAKISGSVTDGNGNPLSGVTVRIIRQSDSTFVESATTDSLGEYEVVDLSDTEKYHVTASLDDGSDKWNSISKPHIEAVFTRNRQEGPIDDFEDNDIDEYSFDSNGGWQTQTGTVFEGTYALEGVNPSGGSGTRLRSTGGLPRYPQAGDTFSYRFRPSSSSDLTVFDFAVSIAGEDTDRYYIPTAPNNNAKSIRKEIGGNVTTLTSSDWPHGVGEWFEVEVEWRINGDIIATWYDESGNQLDQLTANDTELTSGGIGYRHYNYDTSAAGYWDIVQLTSASAGTTGGIDDFEDGDMSEYSEIVGGDYSVQTATVSEGNYALQLGTGASSNQVRLRSVSGLPRYPARANKFSQQTRFDSGQTDGLHRWYFGVADGQNYYYVELDNANGALRIGRAVDGTAETLAFTSASFPEDEWLKTVISWNSQSRIQATTTDSSGNQIAQTSVYDAHHSRGGIGWQRSDGDSSSNSYHFIDDANLESVDEFGTETGVIDHFDDGDLSEYEFPNSDPSDWDVSGSIATANPSGFLTHIIKSSEGLPLYPGAGDTIEFRVKAVDLNDPDDKDSLRAGIIFGSQNEANESQYEPTIRGETAGTKPNTLEFQKKDASGNIIDIDEVSGAYSNGNWYVATIDWGRDGTITFSCPDDDGNVPQLTVTDELFEAGGIGLTANGTAETKFDYIKIV